MARSVKQVNIIPDFMKAFFARRLVDIAAIVTTAFGAFLVLSLLSYHPYDASFNTAAIADGQARLNNIGGLSGARLADLLIQSLGYAALIPALLVTVSGFLWFRRIDVPLSMGPRVAFGAVAVVCAAAALSGLNSPDHWQGIASMGGFIGVMITNFIFSLTSGLTGSTLSWIVYPLCGLGAVMATVLASGISVEAWANFTRKIVMISAGFVAGLFSKSSAFAEWVKENDGRSAQPKVKAPKAKKQSRVNLPPLNSEEAGDNHIEQPDFAPIDEPHLEKAAPHSPVIAVPKKKASSSKQASFSLNYDSDWEFPPVDLLQEDKECESSDLDEKALKNNATLLKQILDDYGVEGEIVKIHPGPVVTLYEFEPAPGTKSSRIISLSDDIARSMSAVSVRAAVVPGRNVIGIEIPNRKRRIVYMRSILETQEFNNSSAKLPLILGKDIGGAPIIADLAKMPHLLVAGTTGSGKSVAVNTMITSLLYRLTPEQCRFIMIDPKMLELSVYNDIPHLLSPVVTEPGKAVVSLKWTVHEMEERYRAMSKLGVRNIEGYNARIREALKKGDALTRRVQTGFDPDTGKPVFEEQPLDMAELPYIVVVVDEFADLMLVAGKEVENAIQRLAQMARAAGIHIIMATQRPSVDVITGVIKANFPTRISFAVTSKIDSRTILGEGGAEQLLGMGDMLYMAAGGRIKRVHAPFMEDDEVNEVVDHLKAQAEPSYLEDVTGGDEGTDLFDAFGEESEGGSNVDELYDEAVAIVAREGKASTSFIQRHLQIGYNRAARIVEEMERQGVISKATPTGKREVLVGDHSG